MLHSSLQLVSIVIFYIQVIIENKEVKTAEQYVGKVVEDIGNGDWQFKAFAIKISACSLQSISTSCLLSWQVWEPCEPLV